MLKKTLQGGFAHPGLSTLSQFELLSVFLAALAPSQSETTVGGVAASSVSVAWAKSLEEEEEEETLFRG